MAADRRANKQGDVTTEAVELLYELFRRRPSDVGRLAGHAGKVLRFFPNVEPEKFDEILTNVIARELESLDGLEKQTQFVAQRIAVIENGIRAGNMNGGATVLAALMSALDKSSISSPELAVKLKEAQLALDVTRQISWAAQDLEKGYWPAATKGLEEAMGHLAGNAGSEDDVYKLLHGQISRLQGEWAMGAKLAKELWARKPDSDGIVAMDYNGHPLFLKDVQVAMDTGPDATFRSTLLVATDRAGLVHPGIALIGGAYEPVKFLDEVAKAAANS
jgi:hypothetical protein